MNTSFYSDRLSERHSFLKPLKIKISSWIQTTSSNDNTIPAFLFEPTLDFLQMLENYGNKIMIQIKDTNSVYDKKVLCTFDMTTNFGTCPSNFTNRTQHYVGFLKEDTFQEYPINEGYFEIINCQL